MRCFLIVLFHLMILCHTGYAQSHFGLGGDQRTYRILDRLYTKYDTLKAPLDKNFISSVRVHQLIQKALTTGPDPSFSADLDFLKHQYWHIFDTDKGKSSFYGPRKHLFTYHNQDARITIDPAINFQIGKDRENDNTIFRNTRGIKVSGALKEKLFFHSHIYETQAGFLPHIEWRINTRNAISGQGFFKRYQSEIIDDISGWDFLDADAVLTYRPSGFFRASLGHSNLFLGNGYRSLFLSNYSDNFFFLELQTSVGILGYKNIFAELAPEGSTKDDPGDLLAPKKYLAAHYLTIRPNRNLEFSLFEAVIFGRENNFELQYLNPVILYRVVEQSLDSPDNVLLGLETSYKIANTAIVYAQLIMDEFRIAEAFSGSGWWGNKTGVQAGIRWFDAFFTDNLDVRIEYNSVRPFTYAHRQYSSDQPYVIGAYSHYNQELAHPLGANFRELLVVVNYPLGEKWSLLSKIMWARTGTALSRNVGNDILQPNESRMMDFDNRTGQGVNVDIFQLMSSISYMLYHNYYFDFQLWYRNQASTSSAFDMKSLYFGLSFRANGPVSPLDDV